MLVQTQCKRATTETYKLLPEWEEQRVDAYPNTSPLKEWPSEPDMPVTNNEIMDAQAITKPKQASEGDTAANEGESSPTTATSTDGANQNNCSTPLQQQLDPSLTISPIDLSTAGFWRSERMRRP